MRYLLILTAILCVSACSLHAEIEDTASSWQGHQLAQVQAAWGAPSTATDAGGWTSWKLGNPDGGWIVRFHTDNRSGRIDEHEVSTWGTLPSDLPHELAPNHHTF